MSSLPPEDPKGHSIAVAPIEPMTDGRSKSPRRILMADPDVQARTALGEMLAEAGYEVAYATDGSSAIRLHEQNRFNLIIMEIFMPGTDGLEVLMALCGKPSAPGFILLSRKSRVPAEAFMRLAQYLGARYYLPKPFQPEQLLAAVRQALNEA